MEERRKNIAQRFVSWVDRRHLVSVRAAVVAATVWLTWFATVEAFRLSYALKMSGLELAAVIGAITAPICALQGWVFKAYMDAKDRTP